MSARGCISLLLGAVLLVAETCCASEPRTLLISVLETSDADLARELLSNTSARGVDEAGYHAATGVYGTYYLRPSDGFQQVRVVEGQTAHISTRYSVPEVRFLWAEKTRRGLFPNVDLVNRESTSGFDVRAELHGKKVQVELHRYSAPPESEFTGSALHRNIRTTVEGDLGGWLDAGGSLFLDHEPHVNHVYSLNRNSDEQIRVLIKLELAP